MAVMLEAGTAGLAAGGEAAVLGLAVVGLAAPGCREVLRDSSWAVPVGRAAGEALLVSGAPARAEAGKEAVGFPSGAAEGVLGGTLIPCCLEMGSKLSDSLAF